MRIVVNDIAASTGGAMSILRDFYACVCENDYENEWIFLLNSQYFEETENVRIITLPEIKKNKFKKLWFDFVAGKKMIEDLKPDIVFSMQNIITFGLTVPQIVYIHQPVPFQAAKRFSLLRGTERKMAIIQNFLGAIIKWSARKSDRIIVQTQWMKEAVCRLCQVPEEKVLTSLPPVKPIAVEGNVTFDRTTFFYPTSSVLYKNNDCIYKASEMLNSKNVDHKITVTLPPERSNGSVICTGRLPYEEVLSQYQCATLLFPSYIETFGYPLAEARMMGTIVLAADTAFAQEVLAGYENGYFFDPFKPEELANLMEQVITGQLEKKDVAAEKTEKLDGWEQVIRWVLEMKE